MYCIQVLGPRTRASWEKEEPMSSRDRSWTKMKMYIVQFCVWNTKLSHDYQKSNEINNHDFDMLKSYICKNLMVALKRTWVSLRNPFWMARVSPRPLGEGRMTCLHDGVRSRGNISLGIAYLVEKIKFKLLFHSPLAEWVFFKAFAWVGRNGKRPLSSPWPVATPWQIPGASWSHSSLPDW